MYRSPRDLLGGHKSFGPGCVLHEISSEMADERIFYKQEDILCRLKPQTNRGQGGCSERPIIRPPPDAFVS